MILSYPQKASVVCGFFSVYAIVAMFWFLKNDVLLSLYEFLSVFHLDFIDIFPDECRRIFFLAHQ